MRRCGTPKYAGKVGWRDDAVESVQMAALATGQDMNNPADLDKVKDKLLALKPQIKTFWSSEDEWNKHIAAGDYDIAVYWSGSAARSKKAINLPVEFVVPKEGAIGWFDGLSIAANAPNPDGAHAFIDFMVDPEFYVKWDTECRRAGLGQRQGQRRPARRRHEPHGPGRSRGGEAAAVDGAADRRAAAGQSGAVGRGEDVVRAVTVAMIKQRRPAWTHLRPDRAGLYLADAHDPAAAVGDALFQLPDRGAHGRPGSQLHAQALRRFLPEGLLLVNAWRSVELGLYVTTLLPPARLSGRAGAGESVKGRWREALFLLIVLPFWSNALVRTFSWTMVLRAPLDILFTYPAIVIGLVHAYLPYMILTCYVSLQAIDDSLIEAARSLGATRWQAFRRIILPLSLPGVLAGMILIFVPVIGSFMEPRILGGKHGIMLGP